MLAGKLFGVEQHLRWRQLHGAQVAHHRFGLLALIDPDKAHMGVIFLGLLQHRHLAAARRAPGRPEVDDQRLALIAAKINSLRLCIDKVDGGQCRRIGGR